MLADPWLKPSQGVDSYPGMEFFGALILIGGIDTFTLVCLFPLSLCDVVIADPMEELITGCWKPSSSEEYSPPPHAHCISPRNKLAHSNEVVLEPRYQWIGKFVAKFKTA